MVCCEYNRQAGITKIVADVDEDYDLIGVFSSWAIQIYKLVTQEKQEFHIRYNKLTTMVENKDHLL